jgi:hypothetical protein
MPGKPDLSPNDFVKELTEELAETGVEPLATRVDAATSADEVVGALARSDGVPNLVSFAGYLGATVTHDESDWCVLYLDVELRTFLLVEKDGIVRRKPVKDEKAPSGMRDVIWVKAEAAVGRGGGPQPVESQFLTGEFTRAGDFDAPVSGGTLAAATGVFCEARSAACCYRRTRH